ARAKAEHAQPDVGRPRVFREHPRVTARCNAVTEVENNRVGVDRRVIHDVLRAALHITRTHAGIQTGPASHGAFDSIGTDHDPRADLAASGARIDRHGPSIAIALHPYGIDARSHVGTGFHGLSG